MKTKNILWLHPWRVTEQGMRVEYTWLETLVGNDYSIKQKHLYFSNFYEEVHKNIDIIIIRGSLISALSYGRLLRLRTYLGRYYPQTSVVVRSSNDDYLRGAEIKGFQTLSRNNHIHDIEKLLNQNDDFGTLLPINSYYEENSIKSQKINERRKQKEIKKVKRNKIIARIIGTIISAGILYLIFG